MEKKLQEEYFIKYRKMIEQSVWKASRSFKAMEFDELRAQAYFIFCEALESYDSNKASFSTHLHNRLHTVNDFCIYLNRRHHKDITIFEDDKYQNDFRECLSRIEEKMYLTKDAQFILEYILGREWENVEATRKCIPRYTTIKILLRKKNWDILRIKTAWAEIINWWRTPNYLDFEHATN